MTDAARKCVLIADDDRGLVDVLALRCRLAGLDVLSAYDAFTALSLVKSAAPDVICLDVGMPSGSGLGVCEMLSADAACREIPVVIITGKRDEDTIRRCHLLCAYYVEKCPDLWSRVGPLLEELLGIPVMQSAAARAEPLPASALAQQGSPP